MTNKLVLPAIRTYSYYKCPQEGEDGNAVQEWQYVTAMDAGVLCDRIEDGHLIAVGMPPNMIDRQTAMAPICVEVTGGDADWYEIAVRRVKWHDDTVLDEEELSHIEGMQGLLVFDGTETWSLSSNKIVQVSTQCGELPVIIRKKVSE